MSNTNNTWREYIVTIPASSQYDFSFPDTFPNQAIITNYGAGQLYTGISMIPDATKYDVKIGASSSEIVARPNSFNRLYFYNPLASNVSVKIVSVLDTFSISDMKSMNVNIGGDIADALKFDGIITGFSASLPAGSNPIGDVGFYEPLPAGTNNIGYVDIASMPALPAGTNNIGKVDINTLPALPTGTNVIGTVKSERASSYLYGGSTLAPAGSAVHNFVFSEITMFSNDGANDIKIKFMDLSSVYGSDIVIKPGEVLSMRLKGNGCTVSSVAGTTYRILLNGGI